MRGFHFISTLAIIAALALAAGTSILSYFAVVADDLPKCSGQELLLGYRTGAADFSAWPLFSLFFVIPVVMAQYSRKTNDLLTTYDIAIFEYSSFRVTLGMFILLSSLFGFVALNG